MCAAAAGCGGGGSGGGGSAPPSPVPCQAGDADLGSVVPSYSRGLIQLPDVALSNQVQLGVGPVWESGSIGLCLPDDVISVVALPSPGIPTSWQASGYDEVIDTSSVDALQAMVTPELMLPRGPLLPAQGGRHAVRFAGDTPQTLRPVLGLRRGALTFNGVFALNLVLVQDAFASADEAKAAFDSASYFDSVYASVGLRVSALGAGSIPDPAWSTVSTAQFYDLSQVGVTPSAEYPPLPDAVTVYFVRELLSGDTAGNVLGQAMGVPGLPGVLGKLGVVISVDAHRGPTGAIVSSALWFTVSHEVAHWLGVRHTSERSGKTFDHLADTPECSAARDTNMNGLLEPGECAGAGTDNLMFWYYDPHGPPKRLTADQGVVLRSSYVAESR